MSKDTDRAEWPDGRVDYYENDELSKRAQRAVDLMMDGAEPVHRLERCYTGGEKWTWRLLADGTWDSVIKGFGFQTFDELRRKGFIRPTFESNTSVCKRYRLHLNNHNEQAA